MSRFHSNQFALFGHEPSDSDDSGYVEDDPCVPAEDHVTLAHTPLKQADQEVWQVVRRRQPAETTHRSAGYRWERNSVRRTRHAVGMIVQHVDLHLFPSGNAPRDQGNVVNLSRGGEALEKYRMFLIVDELDNSVNECPVLTYGETGLRYREEATWPEYCSVRPPHIPVEDFTNQSPNNIVLGIDRITWFGRMSESMVVRLSDARSRDTDDGVAVRGVMSPESRDYASDKMADLMRRATMTARW